MKIEKREGMDVSGATISDETTPSGTRDIYFPNQVRRKPFFSLSLFTFHFSFQLIN